MRKRVAALALATALGIAACAAKKPMNAEQLVQQADENYRDGAFELAISNYRELLDQYPFSDYTEEAELRIAHSQYLAGDYIEAIVSLSDFQRRHPTSPYLPLVGYDLGMCYKAQIGTIDRDQTAASSAESYFNAVIQQYPSSPYAELAREQLAQCRDSLAAHELYVAQFYSHKGNAAAAESRLLEVVGRYPDSTPAGEAMFRLAHLYRREDDLQLAALAFASVVKQYPESDYAPGARRALTDLEKKEPVNSADPRSTLLALSGYTPSNLANQPVEVPGIETAQRPRRVPVVPAEPKTNSPTDNAY